MPGYSKLGRAIMRAKSLSPVVTQSRIKIHHRKPKPMDHTQALAGIYERLAKIEAKLSTTTAATALLARQAENEAIAQIADACAKEWTERGVKLAAGQGNPFHAFAKAIRERVK